MPNTTPPKTTETPKHKGQDAELDRAAREPKGARVASERDSLAQGGVDTGALSPGKSGGANLA